MPPLTKLILSLGSNTGQKENMENAESLLRTLFKQIRFSDSKWTEPVGIESDLFLNKIAVVYTAHGLQQICKALRNIERKCGRSRSLHKSNVVPMDIDVLQFGDAKMHAEDWERGYIRELIQQMEEPEETIA